jgi:mRNA interferase RelE/StbE
MYKIILEKSVQKFLEKHKWEDLIKSFSYSLEILSLEPYENNLDIKILIWLPNSYRLRIWKYRFIYEIIEEKIIINFYDALTRWDIYKKYN